VIGVLGGRASEQRLCSRAGCNVDAQWAILWRNPKIHSVSRRKTWLTCDEHREYLRDFLDARSFPLELVPIAELPTVST